MKRERGKRKIKRGGKDKVLAKRRESRMEEIGIRERLEELEKGREDKDGRRKGKEQRERQRKEKRERKINRQNISD